MVPRSILAESRAAVIIGEETDRIYKTTDAELEVFGVGEVCSCGCCCCCAARCEHGADMERIVAGRDDRVGRPNLACCRH